VRCAVITTGSRDFRGSRVPKKHCTRTHQQHKADYLEVKITPWVKVWVSVVQPKMPWSLRCHSCGCAITVLFRAHNWFQ